MDNTSIDALCYEPILLIALLYRRIQLGPKTKAEKTETFLTPLLRLMIRAIHDLDGT